MGQPVPVWQGTVDTEGKLRLEASGLFKSYLRRFRNKPIQLVIKKLARRKSHSQLGYIWGVLYPIIAEHFGYHDTELDALHDGCMRHLRGLKPEPNPLQLRVSLSEMAHDDVSAYIEDLRFWALTQHGCVTPDAEKSEAA